MKTRLVTTLFLLSFAALLISFCPGCGASGKRALNVVGSTSVAPFAEKLAQAYHDKYPDRNPINVQGGGSAQGVVSAENGLADIGTCSCWLNDEQKKQLTPVLIARDGIAVIVNNDNPIATLTIEQIRSLFSGKITNWKDLGGADKPITLISREEGSGTRISFQELVMKEDEISGKALFQSSNGSVKALVQGDPNAIGYMSLGQVGTEVKAVKIDGVAPSAADVINGTYKFSRPFLFVTKGKPSPEAQQFIDFVLAPDGQDLLKKDGLVPPQ